jgi:hypothetical protein
VKESAQGQQLDLTWQVNKPVPADITLFVHALDDKGQLIGQADGDPVAGAFPFWQWAPGTVAGDSRILFADGQIREVLVGLYNRTTGDRLPAISPSGDQLTDNAVALPVEPWPAISTE